MDSWATKYIGLPYKELGRDKNGVDCYGLCCVVYHDELGIDIPDFSGFGYRNNLSKEDKERNQKDVEKIVKNESENEWVEVSKSEVQPFDLVLFRICGYVVHIGIMVNKDEMLHSFNGMDCVREKIGFKWGARVYKFIRHRARMDNAPSSSD